MTLLETLLLIILAAVCGTAGILYHRQRRYWLTRQRQWRLREKALRKRNRARLIVLEHLPQPLLMLDERQQVARANSAARSLFGECTGSPLNSFCWQPALLDAVDCAYRDGSNTRGVDIRIVTSGKERHFNVLLERLPVAREMRTRLVLLFSDITATRLTQRINADFVANASHELRTPLTSIMGFLETLQGSAGANPALRDRFLGIITREATRMQALVEDLLTLSTIERHALHEPEDVLSFDRLVTQTVETLTPKALERQLVLALHTGQPLPVKGDGVQLQQVAFNIIENACKYATSGTTIHVSLEESGQQACLTVTNSGDGISADDLPRVSERFYRTRQARDSGVPGTGLGLAIVKNILQRHGGRLVISSVPGASVTATVRLPLATGEPVP